MEKTEDTKPTKSLYVPELEKDSCGTGLIANLNGNKTHKLVQDAIFMLSNMEHRGACGCEPNTGDGAGILTQIPHDFFVEELEKQKIELPDFGGYGVGMIFFPKNDRLQDQCRVLFNDYIDELGFELIGYRPVPTNNDCLGKSALASEPYMEQVFVRPKDPLDLQVLERRLFVLRKYAIHNIHDVYPQTRDMFYMASFSYKTIVYKLSLIHI